MSKLSNYSDEHNTTFEMGEIKRPSISDYIIQHYPGYILNPKC